MLLHLLALILALALCLGLFVAYVVPAVPIAEPWRRAIVALAALICIVIILRAAGIAVP